MKFLYQALAAGGKMQSFVLPSSYRAIYNTFFILKKLTNCLNCVFS